MSALTRGVATLMTLVAGTFVTGCGSLSAGMILKTPVANQCAGSGLQGCDEITEGVILYLDGDKAAGEELLIRGAAKNPPDKIQEYAKLVKTLGELPGASKYYEPISGIVGILTGEESQDLSAGSQGVSQTPGQMGADDPPEPGSTLAASNQLAKSSLDYARDGVVTTPANTPDWCAKNFGSNVSCEIAVRGPLFITDVASFNASCQGQSFAIMNATGVRMQLEGPMSIHGSHMALGSNDMLVIIQKAKPEQSKKTKSSVVVLDEVEPDWSCVTYWAGYVP